MLRISTLYDPKKASDAKKGRKRGGKRKKTNRLGTKTETITTIVQDQEPNIVISRNAGPSTGYEKKIVKFSRQFARDDLPADNACDISTKIYHAATEELDEIESVVVRRIKDMERSPVCSRNEEADEISNRSSAMQAEIRFVGHGDLGKDESVAGVSVGVTGSPRCECTGSRKKVPTQRGG